MKFPQPTSTYGEIATQLGITEFQVDRVVADVQKKLNEDSEILEKALEIILTGHYKNTIDSSIHTFIKEINPKCTAVEMQILASFVEYLKTGDLRKIPGAKID